MDSPQGRSAASMRRLKCETTRRRACQPCGGRASGACMRWASKLPALCLGDEKIPKDLHAGNRFELLRVDEIGVERDAVGLPEQLHQPSVLLDQIVGQKGNPDPSLACAQDSQHIVECKYGRAR